MTLEGTYAYGCPMPDGVLPRTPAVPVVPYPVVPAGQITIGPLAGEDLQGLLDTVAAQRQELEGLRGALALVLDLLTPQQRQGLRAMAALLGEE